jgi:hypothetical protein
MSDLTAAEHDEARAEREAQERAEAEERRALEPLLQFFEYGHLPIHLRTVSAHFGDLARLVTETLPRNPERTVALRKLLEAKDCAVRAVLYR